MKKHLTQLLILFFAMSFHVSCNLNDDAIALPSHAAIITVAESVSPAVFNVRVTLYTVNGSPVPVGNNPGTANANDTITLTINFNVSQGVVFGSTIMDSIRTELFSNFNSSNLIFLGLWEPHN